jgi:hypothetical protein
MHVLGLDVFSTLETLRTVALDDRGVSIHDLLSCRSLHPMYRVKMRPATNPMQAGSQRNMVAAPKATVARAEPMKRKASPKTAPSWVGVLMV